MKVRSGLQETSCGGLSHLPRANQERSATLQAAEDLLGQLTCDRADAHSAFGAQPKRSGSVEEDVGLCVGRVGRREAPQRSSPRVELQQIRPTAAGVPIGAPRRDDPQQTRWVRQNSSNEVKALRFRPGESIERLLAFVKPVQAATPGSDPEPAVYILGDRRHAGCAWRCCLPSPVIPADTARMSRWPGRNDRARRRAWPAVRSSRPRPIAVRGSPRGLPGPYGSRA